ncbi:hypothetical protein AB6D11_00205 [Vibrio splendidus]
MKTIFHWLNCYREVQLQTFIMDRVSLPMRQWLCGYTSDHDNITPYDVYLVLNVYRLLGHQYGHDEMAGFVSELKPLIHSQVRFHQHQTLSLEKMKLTLRSKPRSMLSWYWQSIGGYVGLVSSLEQLTVPKPTRKWLIQANPLFSDVSDAVRLVKWRGHFQRLSYGRAVLSVHVEFYWSSLVVHRSDNDWGAIDGVQRSLKPVEVFGDFEHRFILSDFWLCKGGRTVNYLVPLHSEGLGLPPYWMAPGAVFFQSVERVFYRVHRLVTIQNTGSTTEGFLVYGRENMTWSVWASDDSFDHCEHHGGSVVFSPPKGIEVAMSELTRVELRNKGMGLIHKEGDGRDAQWCLDMSPVQEIPPKEFN